MSDRNDTDQDTTPDTDQDTGQDTRQKEQDDVAGVDTDPDGKTAIVVDTHERLTAKEDEPALEDIPTEELEKEREERLSPENRPDNVEVDNSQRTFNPETGVFEDSDVEPPEGAPFATTEAEESNTQKEPKDNEEAEDAEQSKEAKESKDTES